MSPGALIATQTPEGWKSTREEAGPWPPSSRGRPSASLCCGRALRSLFLVPPAKGASVRALLFDISFLMLCHVAQTYGSEVSALHPRGVGLGGGQRWGSDLARAAASVLQPPASSSGRATVPGALSPSPNPAAAPLRVGEVPGTMPPGQPEIPQDFHLCPPPSRCHGMGALLPHPLQPGSDLSPAFFQPCPPPPALHNLALPAGVWCLGGGGASRVPALPWQRRNSQPASGNGPWVA